MIKGLSRRAPGATPKPSRDIPLPATKTTFGGPFRGSLGVSLRGPHLDKYFDHYMGVSPENLLGGLGQEHPHFSLGDPAALLPRTSFPRLCPMSHKSRASTLTVRWRLYVKTSK